MSIIRNYIDGQFRNEKKEEVGIGGFTALARVMEKTVRTSDVPTVFLEDGSPISDHIIRKPLTIVIEGNVSDVHIRPSNLISAIRRVQQTLGIITQYEPGRTTDQVSKVSALINNAVNAIDKIDSEINAGQQLAGYLGLIGEASGSNIKSFVDNMETHFAGSTPISIDMPYNKYDRMRITSLEVEKDNENSAISFRLEAQQINFVKNLLVPLTIVKDPADNVDGQCDDVEDKGVQNGEEVPHSFIDYFTSLFEG